MAKRRFKVAYPFSNGDYYIEVREGNGFHNWVKVGDVPKDLRHLLIQGRHEMESASCVLKSHAKIVAERLNLTSKDE